MAVEWDTLLFFAALFVVVVSALCSTCVCVRVEEFMCVFVCVARMMDALFPLAPLLHPGRKYPDVKVPLC